LLTFVAVLLAEAVWILAVPPFRGSDEVDHVFRASGVASGQVHLTRNAEGGGGQLVWVPTEVVDAAHEQCVSRMYVTEADCAPVGVSRGRSLVATAAGTYDPIYYAVVGVAGRPFHGSGVDYAMRAATALLCALLIGLGVGALSFAGTGRWVTLGVLAALTPEVMFSGAIVAPNGPEIGLGFLLWSALLGAVRQPSGSVSQRRLLALAGVAAVPLMFVRGLGPLWVLMDVVAVATVVGVHHTREVVTRNRACLAMVSVAVALGLAWWYVWRHIAAHAAGGSGGPPVVPQWARALDVPLFVLQMVGAFPFREIPAPFIVYPMSFFAIVLLIAAALRRGVPSRTRGVVLVLAVATLIVPVLLSLAFMSSVGAIWQGRYILPFAIGILPLCGLVLDDAGFAPFEGKRLAALAGVLLAASQVICPYHVQQLELHRRASLADASWWHASMVVLGGLMLIACGLAWLMMRVTLRSQFDPEPEMQNVT
jgi:hypothetical protein